MSLHRLKETLHACSSSSSQPQSQPRSPPPPALLPRRPPKTSLSQQLLRLEAAAASSSSYSSRIAQLPPVPRPPIEKPREDDEPLSSSEEEDERRTRPISRPRPPPLPAAALEHRGPFEPLVLSPPEERPVVQVPPSINCRLLAHQRDGVRFLYNLYRNNHGGVLGDDIDNPDGCPMCPFCLVLPCLVKLQQISNHLELIKPNPKDEVEKQKKDAELAAAVFDTDIDLVGGSAKSENFMGLSDAEHCGKMRALERLLSLWTQQGDKILLFSYSVRFSFIYALTIY
nr:unnamed protein product [Digitaria exilis]